MPKPVCASCVGCVVTRLCPKCPESVKAAAEEVARLQCSPCLSEPACVPPEAAASFDTLEAIWQELSRVKVIMTKLEESLLARIEERADAQLTPQDLTWSVAGLD
jgi:hypothetical protein